MLSDTSKKCLVSKKGEYYDVGGATLLTGCTYISPEANKGMFPPPFIVLPCFSGCPRILGTIFLMSLLGRQIKLNSAPSLRRN